MKLRELLQGVAVLEIHADPETEITSIAYDSRKAEPGCLFAAISGFASDGNRFIPMALEKGAAAVITARKPEEDVPYVLVASDRLALARTLAQQSPVLLLDELAAGLDLARMLELFDLLERRRRAGAALLLVMHDCNLAAQYATRLLGLREGRVLFDGPVRRCFTAENLRALYAVDLHIVPHPRNGLPQALPLRPRGPEYREDSPHEA